MVKLKKYRVHKAICDICNGNGFVKINFIIDKLLKKSYIIVQMKGTHD